MTTKLVTPADWNLCYASPEAHIADGYRFDESKEGSEFELTQVVVGPTTRYRIVDRKPVVIEVKQPKP